VSPIRLLPVVAALAISVSACAAGQGDATSHEHSPRVIDASVGSVKIANVQVIPATGAALPASPSPTDTSSASPSASPSSSSSAGSSAASSAQAYLTLTISSTQLDELTGASVGSGGTVTPTSSASLVVRPGQLLVIGDPQTSTGSSGLALAVSGLSQPPVVGTTMSVTLNFRNAGSVTVQAPVRDSQPA
jgi:hypothetical protein